jgi:hypothetical protein
MVFFPLPGGTCYIMLQNVTWYNLPDLKLILAWNPRPKGKRKRLVSLFVMSSFQVTYPVPLSVKQCPRLFQDLVIHLLFAHALGKSRRISVYLFAIVLAAPLPRTWLDKITYHDVVDLVVEDVPDVLRHTHTANAHTRAHTNRFLLLRSPRLAGRETHNLAKPDF